MLTAVWSTKGGVGVTAIAAMLALGQAERAEQTLVVDLCGDMVAALGVTESSGPGLADWCATPRRAAETLARIEVAVRPNLTLVRRGTGPLVEAAGLIELLTGSKRQIVVDCGNVREPGFARDVAAAADHRLVVVRACYLTLRAAMAPPVEPTGVVFVRERGRALGLADIEAVIAAPVVAEVAHDVAVARAIDAGLITTRLPRALIRTMGRVIADAA